jgi:hypothetical protein
MSACWSTRECLAGYGGSISWYWNMLTTWLLPGCEAAMQPMQPTATARGKPTMRLLTPAHWQHFGSECLTQPLQARCTTLHGSG